MAWYIVKHRGNFTFHCPFWGLPNLYDYVEFMTLEIKYSI